MKCHNCLFLITLPSITSKGWCKAPAGRFKKNKTIPVNPNIERDCKLYKQNTMINEALEGIKMVMEAKNGNR